MAATPPIVVGSGNVWVSPNTGTWTNIGTTSGFTFKPVHEDEPVLQACYSHGVGVGELGCEECEAVHRKFDAECKKYNKPNPFVTFSASMQNFTVAMNSITASLHNLQLVWGGAVPTYKIVNSKTTLSSSKHKRSRSPRLLAVPVKHSASRRRR